MARFPEGGYTASLPRHFPNSAPREQDNPNTASASFRDSHATTSAAAREHARSWAAAAQDQAASAGNQQAGAQRGQDTPAGTSLGDNDATYQSERMEVRNGVLSSRKVFRAVCVGRRLTRHEIVNVSG